jgi:rare lipoprotein A
VKLKLSQLLCIGILVCAFIVLGGKYAETEEGLASYYGTELAGQPTASGEPFNPYGFTAAHNTLPLGTRLVVFYGGRSVEVVVNDRGPYTGGRELDLSQGAAEYLGLTYAGVDYVDYYVAEGGGNAGGYSAGRSAYSETGYSDHSRTAGHYSGDQISGTYVVQAGDTLSGVAAQLETTVEHLAATNGIENPDLLYVGQVLEY